MYEGDYVHKFAHISDAHLGAFRHPVLRDLAFQAFSTALDECIKRGVDFIIVSGDLFDSNIPDMAILNAAVKKIKEAKDNEIEFYVVCGSHDFSHTQNSIIDILESAGLFYKVDKGKFIDGRLRLKFHVDEKTGVKLCGISGRKSGIEKEYFEILDRESLEKEDGFKVFVFHGGITEYKPEFLAEIESIPISNLPKGFDYYATGHIHENLIDRMPGYGYITYAGPLFGGDYRDLERNAKGQERGFYLVSFSDEVENVEFVKISACDYALIEYDADGKNALKIQRDLLELVEKTDVHGRLVLFKVKGEMSGGKTSDIDLPRIRKLLEEKGALYVLMNYHMLASKEYAGIKVGGGDVREIESKLFKENIGTVKVVDPKLKGELGIRLSVKLLNTLKQEKKEDETKSDYAARIVGDALNTLQLKEGIE